MTGTKFNNTDHNTGIITWYTFSIKLSNIKSCSLHCNTAADTKSSP